MKMIKTGAAALAMLALSQPQMAMAQECVQEADVADAMIYAMPAMVTALESKCSGKLAKNGYLATRGSALKARYSALSSSAWPGASRLIGVFASSGSDRNGQEMASMLSAMPEEFMGPFLNAVIEQKLAEKVPVKQCRNIERGLTLFDPLPAKNMGALAGFLMRFADVDKPKICPLNTK